MILSEGSIRCYGREASEDDGRDFYFRIETEEPRVGHMLFVKIHDHSEPNDSCSCWDNPFILTLERVDDHLYAINWIYNPKQDWSLRRGLGRAAIPLAVLVRRTTLWSDPKRRSGRAHELHEDLSRMGLAERVGNEFTYRHEYLKDLDLVAMKVVKLQEVRDTAPVTMR
jgi:hypothetical protein